MVGENWFSIAAAKMNWASARQKTIAENVANADTPGFVGRDVHSFESFLDAAHDPTRESPEVAAATNSWGGSFDGNKVVLEEQMVLSNQAASSFQLAARLYRKGHDLIGIAVSSK
ncbi:flagellar basal body rod protein FlgB [Paracoccus ravus]|uniref:flagellar basal body rod protein FlgB n=1 Tax=Paracoccus ravus TaxID=2447760 RepID=UPI00106DEA9D|nr:flagellar basal body protein [Paracoccus ravus]